LFSTLSLHDALPISSKPKWIPAGYPTAMPRLPASFRNVRKITGRSPIAIGIPWSLAGTPRGGGHVRHEQKYVQSASLCWSGSPRSEEHTSELQSPDH